VLENSFLLSPFDRMHCIQSAIGAFKSWSTASLPRRSYDLEFNE